MKEECIDKNLTGKCDIASDLSFNMQKKLRTMEDKIDSLVSNQEEFKENISDINIKIGKIYDVLVGNEFTDNVGMIHDIKNLKKRVSVVEKFKADLKTYWWIATVVAVVVAFFFQEAVQSFLNLWHKK